MHNQEIKADILIVGGGLGGVAAALGALEAGRTVVMSEEYDWIGGQLTSQAVPPDEHTWVERFGVTRRYRALRDGTFEGPASELTGIRVLEASDLDAVLDTLPAVGTFEVRPAQ